LFRGNRSSKQLFSVCTARNWWKRAVQNKIQNELLEIDEKV